MTGASEPTPPSPSPAHAPPSPVQGTAARRADGTESATAEPVADRVADPACAPATDSVADRVAGGAGGAVRATAGGAVRKTQASLLNVANLLTMVRLALVPGFVVLLLHGDGHDPAWRSFAWAAFGVAMITDLFDGELARRYGLVTDFGKIADPIADKAIMGAALIGLSALGDLPWWVTAVILFRELGITLMRFWVIRHGVIPASRGGKLKTLTQGVGVGMYILALTGPLASIRAWIMAAAVILTVVTGVDYVRQAVVLRRAGLAREREKAAGATRAPESVQDGPGPTPSPPSPPSPVSSAPSSAGAGHDTRQEGRA